jgi:multicomponent Na+:H+ antiporter subunit C
LILENYICSIILIVLGIYTLLVKKNLIKIVIGMGLIDYGINLLIITVGFNPGGTAPIFASGELNPQSFFVDPVPQALTLISIVIGACVTAMTLSLVIKIYENYGTIDAGNVRRLRG